MRHFPKLSLAFLTAAFLAAVPFAAVAQQTGIPISQLPRAALPLTGTETIPLVQNGFTRQAPASSLLAISVPPRPTTLGGVFLSSAPAGEYAIGVDQNGNILYSALIGNLAGHASGDLAIANNLSDLANVTTARTNLGLGAAATQPLAAFLQPSNNLSDVANATTARTNLGLGTASTQVPLFFSRRTICLIWRAQPLRARIWDSVPRRCRTLARAARQSRF